MVEKITINENAITIRERFGVDEKSPVDIFGLMENQDELTTVFLPMSDGISGLCIRAGSNQIIAINSRLSKGRQQFTAAHELCHLFFHKDRECLYAKEFDIKKR